MLLKLLFWTFACIDLAVLLLLAVLGLAAAAPSQTSPAAVGLFLLPPAALLALGVIVLTRATTPLWQWLALLLVAAPALQVAVHRLQADAALAPYLLPDGGFSRFAAGDERMVERAIESGELDAALAALPGADARLVGRDGTTLLELALMRLAKHPRREELVSALLAAGAPVERGGQWSPLEAAVLTTREAGIEGVRLLLAAGAAPNARGPHGEPAYFAACSGGIAPAIMELLLEHGADLAARDAEGRGIAIHAAMRSNWAVLLLVLERGAEWRNERLLQGQTLLESLERNEAWASKQPGYRESIAWLLRESRR